MTYQEWKTLNKSSDKRYTGALFDFECNNPIMVQDYKRRLESEKKKRSEIMEIQDTMARHKAISENMALFGR